MANVDAFNQGFDAGMGKKKSKGKSDLIKQPTPTKVANPGEFKKGGKVKRTGIAKVHAGEVVLTAKQAKKYGKKKASGHKCVAGKR